MENWIAKPTGNMTLSVVADNGVQIVKIDMLSSGTMKAETNGDFLARSLNDLTVIASFSSPTNVQLPEILQHPEAGTSPFPWSVDYNPGKRKLVIRDAHEKKIAERVFPATFLKSRIDEICSIVQTGITRFPSMVAVSH